MALQQAIGRAIELRRRFPLFVLLMLAASFIALAATGFMTPALKGFGLVPDGTFSVQAALVLLGATVPFAVGPVALLAHSWVARYHEELQVNRWGAETGIRLAFVAMAACSVPTILLTIAGALPAAMAPGVMYLLSIPVLFVLICRESDPARGAVPAPNEDDVEQETEGWRRLGLMTLARAHGDEPEYTLEDIKSP